MPKKSRSSTTPEEFVLSRDTQGLKAGKTFADVFDKLELTPEAAQRIVESGKLTRGLNRVLKNCAAPAEFDHQELPSNCGYNPSYFAGANAHQVEESVFRLKQFFPELEDADVNLDGARKHLPSNAEGWFPIVRWEALGKDYTTVFEERMIPALSAVFFPKFNRRHVAEFLKPGLVRHPRTVEMYDRIVAKQNGCDILIIPAQFGLRHRGRSVNRARERFARNEFGLDVFSVGCMLLVSPMRLKPHGDGRRILSINCGGNDLDWSEEMEIGGDPWIGSPYFHYRDEDEKILLSVKENNNYSNGFGIASGFLWDMPVPAFEL